MLSPAAFHNPPGLRFPSVRTHQTVPRSRARTPVGVMLRSSLLAFPGLAAEPFQIGLFVEMLPERVEVEGTGREVEAGVPGPRFCLKNCIQT